MSLNITTANASVMITWDELFDGVSKPLENFAPTSAWRAGEIVVSEYIDSMDGYFNTGYVYNSFPFSMTFNPFSNSLQYFQQWMTAMRIMRDCPKATLSIIIPKRAKMTLTDGVLVSMPSLPNVDKRATPITVNMRFGHQRTVYTG